jgi:hypothetical protein
MTKAIRSYPKAEQNTVAQRRVNQKTLGLGYWSAVEYLKRSGKVVVEKTDSK